MKPSKRLLLLVTLAMISFAMIDNVRGIFVPTFKTTYTLTNTGIGWVLLISTFAYTLASFLAGKLITKYSQKSVLMAGTLLSTLGILSIVLIDSRFGFVLALILMNTGIAFSGLAINTTIPKLKVKNHAFLMNFVHFLYGVGATFTQRTGGYLLSINWSFKTIYLSIMVFYVLVFFIAGLTPMPSEHTEARTDKKFSKAQWRILWLMSIGLGLYVAAELQTGNWMVNYGVNAYGLTENAISRFTAAFFFVFSIGRLVGGFPANKFGYLKSVTYSIAIASVLYTLGLLLNTKGLWLISASGIFFSIAYPTGLLSLKLFFEDTISKAAGVVVTLSSAVNMVFGLLIGRLADLIGIRYAMFSIPLALFFCALLLGTVWLKGAQWIETEKGLS